MSDQPLPQGDASSNSSVPLASIGGVVALGGFALMAVEVVRTLTGGVLGTIGTALLWAGVGVLAVGLLLLVLSLAGGDETPPWGAEPASDLVPEPVADTTPAPVAVPAPPPVAAPAPVPVAEPAPTPAAEPTAAVGAEPAAAPAALPEPAPPAPEPPSADGG